VFLICKFNNAKLVRGATYVLDIDHHLRLKCPQHFREWICLHVQVEGEVGGPTVVGRYEHVQNISHIYYNTPSSEYFKVQLIPYSVLFFCISTGLLIVNAPKTGPLSFVNYEDICYSGGDLRAPQYYLIHQPTWYDTVVEK
jgi:hypothetical protein